MTAYTAWENQFKNQIAAVTKTNSKIVLEAAKELMSRIEQRTPVGNPALWSYPAPKDYVPGTLRASWVMQQEVRGSYVQVAISNDQPYAERVEFGWSTQAPKGMMRISVMEFPSIVDRIASKYKV